ncbi:hypothetical protein CK222_30155 [Mesorhizobium sp. WSM3866]|nr:hypothetical protein CK222_30155 [Mesorhizobium sp. WSM3866]
MLELVVLGEHIAGHPGAEVNWASMGGGRGVPRERDNRQVDIRLNEGLLIAIASEQTVVPSSVLTETARSAGARGVRADSSIWRSFGTRRSRV